MKIESQNKLDSWWDKPSAPWIILICLSIIWGSSFILIKKSLLAFTPNEVGTLRIGISTLAILPLLFLRWKRQDFSLWPWFLIVGLTGNLLPALLFSNAETRIDSGIAGVLNGLTPLFTLIIAWLFFRHPYRWVQALGILLGFIGASFLIIFGDKAIDLTHLTYGFLIVLATICYAFSVNTVNAKLKQINPLDTTIMSFTSVGLFAWVYLLLYTDFIEHATIHPDASTSVIAILILSLVGTVVSTIIFYKLVQQTDAIFASIVSYLIPIVALLWGIFDGEQLVFMQILGFLLILSGVYLVRLKQSD